MLQVSETASGTRFRTKPVRVRTASQSAQSQSPLTLKLFFGLWSLGGLEAELVSRLRELVSRATGSKIIFY